MTFFQRPHVQIALVAFAVAALGAANWMLEPARALAWLTAISTMAAIWIAVLVMERIGAARRFLAASAVTAGVVLSVSLAGALMDDVVGGGTLGDRAQGVVMGILLIAMGNILPKVVPSLASKRTAAARVQATQRFAGWAFVVAGLVYAGAWMLLAPAQARFAALLACGTATALVIARLAWMIAACNNKPSPTQATRASVD